VRWYHYCLIYAAGMLISWILSAFWYGWRKAKADLTSESGSFHVAWPLIWPIIFPLMGGIRFVIAIFEGVERFFEMTIETGEQTAHKVVQKKRQKQRKHDELPEEKLPKAIGSKVYKNKDTLPLATSKRIGGKR